MMNCVVKSVHRCPLVVVLPAIPYPLNQGYRVVAYTDLEQLSKYYFLNLIIWQVDRNYEFKAIDELLKNINANLFMFYDATIHSKSFYRKIIRNIRDSITYKSLFIPDGVKELSALIENALQITGASEVYFEMSSGVFVQTALFLRQHRTIKTMFRIHNIEAKAFFDGKASQIKGIKKILLPYWNLRAWFELKDEMKSLRCAKKL